MPVCQAVVYCL
ncbi:hypothetical protein F383_29222 [Gossypium arboreum]|uniref:Uncharacterized protein n=1 Tax=Gossypium arboreum TaxID=29729 RepID=A0A0B0PFF1_GOSAR|nr:hypothetical protein F383_29222 [Gossypium arboreum]